MKGFRHNKIKLKIFLTYIFRPDVDIIIHQQFFFFVFHHCTIQYYY